jgi:hypothetical protein
MLHAGALPPGADREHINDAIAVLATLHDLQLTPVETELFVVNTHIRAAGTLDLLLADPDGNRIVGDIKTETSFRDPSGKAVSWATQTAIYAHSLPLLPDGSIGRWENLGHTPPLTDEALIISAHQRHGTARPIVVDLRKGWEAAQHAAAARDLRERNYHRII